jgi:hypothetical protein
VVRGKRKNTALYRSGFEPKVSQALTNLGITHEYEPKDKKLNYTIPESKHTYLPDFVVGNTIFEAKGYMDADTRAKMLRVVKCNPHFRIVMVFQNAKSKLRKNSKTTYADWCDKNGIEWCTIESLPAKIKALKNNL